MTRQQTWAQKAFELVSVKAQNGNLRGTEKSKYKTMCMRFPALLQQSGLVQALHFLSRDDSWVPYLGDLAQVVAVEKDALLRRARTSATIDYMALSQEVAGAAQWMRRIAQAELSNVDEEQGD